MKPTTHAPSQETRQIPKDEVIAALEADNSRLKAENEALRGRVAELTSTLSQSTSGMTEEQYRLNMQDAPCHVGICPIEKCGRCSRELAAIRALHVDDAQAWLLRKQAEVVEAAATYAVNEYGEYDLSEGCFTAYAQRLRTQADELEARDG